MDYKHCQRLGGIPGQVVIGGDSCSKGCEFKSWHRILDEHFCTYLLRNALKFFENY